MSLETGATFGGGRYRVEELVGDGAQGVVHRVFDTRLERHAAMKLSVADTDVAEVRARFERELKMASRFSHPRILQVYDAGDLDDGAPWVVTEWMATGSLQHVLSALGRTGRRLPLRFVKYYGLCVAEALEAVHAAGLVHRDVKPGNVLIAGSGEAKLGDFGIACAADVVDADAVGTPGFMPREQWKGQAEPASDLFALGVCVFVMATGRMPEQASPGLVKRTEIGQAPETLRPFLRRCLAQVPGERWPSAKAAAAALATVDARGDGRERLAKAEQLPPTPPGGLRAAGEDTGAELLFEAVDDTQAHPSTDLPPGRTISQGVPRTVNKTVMADQSVDAWLKPESRSRVGIVVGFVAVILALFAAALLLPKPTNDRAREHIDACLTAVLEELPWSAPGDAGSYGESGDDALLTACAASAADELAEARREALVVSTEDPWLAPRRAYLLARTARYGSARDYAEAAAWYQEAEGCADAGCERLREAADAGRREACMVLEYSQPACAALRTETASRLLALERADVLRRDGLHGLAWTNLQYGLQLPRPEDEAVRCAERRLLERWVGSPDLTAALQGPVNEAIEQLPACSTAG